MNKNIYINPSSPNGIDQNCRNTSEWEQVFDQVKNTHNHGVSAFLNLKYLQNQCLAIHKLQPVLSIKPFEGYIIEQNKTATPNHQHNLNTICSCSGSALVYSTRDKLRI